MSATQPMTEKWADWCEHPAVPPSWVLIPGTDICRECGNHLRTAAGLLARCKDRHEVKR